jgi:hypothetical protein
MQALALPYPINVGLIEGGEWSSSVPDRVVFEGRLGVPLGADLGGGAGRRSSPCSTTASRLRPRSSGPAASSPPAPRRPTTRGSTVAAAVQAERGARAGSTGVPYGADMRLYCARGIPAVMVGTPGLELAHAVDERVRSGGSRGAGADHRRAVVAAPPPCVAAQLEPAGVARGLLGRVELALDQREARSQKPGRRGRCRRSRRAPRATASRPRSSSSR